MKILTTLTVAMAMRFLGAGVASAKADFGHSCCVAKGIGWWVSLRFDGVDPALERLGARGMLGV